MSTVGRSSSRCGVFVAHRGGSSLLDHLLNEAYSSGDALIQRTLLTDSHDCQIALASMSIKLERANPPLYAASSGGLIFHLVSFVEKTVAFKVNVEGGLRTFDVRPAEGFIHGRRSVALAVIPLSKHRIKAELIVQWTEADPWEQDICAILKTNRRFNVIVHHLDSMSMDDGGEWPLSYPNSDGSRRDEIRLPWIALKSGSMTPSVRDEKVVWRAIVKILATLGVYHIMLERAPLYYSSCFDENKEVLKEVHDHLQLLDHNVYPVLLVIDDCKGKFADFIKHTFSKRVHIFELNGQEVARIAVSRLENPHENVHDSTCSQVRGRRWNNDSRAYQRRTRHFHSAEDGLGLNHTSGAWTPTYGVIFGMPNKFWKEVTNKQWLKDTALESNKKSHPYLRRAIVDGHYDDMAHHLDVQFRLLRGDLVSTLSIGLSMYKFTEVHKWKVLRLYTFPSSKIKEGVPKRHFKDVMNVLRDADVFFTLEQQTKPELSFFQGVFEGEELREFYDCLAHCGTIRLTGLVAPNARYHAVHSIFHNLLVTFCEYCHNGHWLPSDVAMNVFRHSAQEFRKICRGDTRRARPREKPSGS
ncbi:unnamed protein product [Angiostrongylus costaricensis]|uniref:Protein kinase domain-containing protein n=1 Tax=Angiostrongylus costaricensis TaxID=334426 RepID=A0A0R3PLJ1_ANGCS|nr:unnamed protein product [Angiostrongylus costaricensis]